MAINGATSRCQRAYHQCLPNTWASYLFRSPPNAVCRTGCLLASFHRQCCNPGCPWAPGTIRAPASGQHRDHTEEGWFHSNGLREAPHHTARHSLQHASICYEVRRWPTTTVRATVPCRERTATWCSSLAPLAPQTVLWQQRRHALGMAVFAWGHMMHEQDASSSFGAKLQCWKRRIGKTSDAETISGL